MKAETLIYVIAISGFVLAAIIELNRLSKESGTVKENNLSTNLFRASLWIFLIIQISSKCPSYNLITEEQYWSKHSLPQIDTTMQVDFMMQRNIYYKSYSRDPIRHDSKSINYDLFDIYDYEDVFVNENIDKKIIIKYRPKNILHDSLRQITIKPLETRDTIPARSLSKVEVDSIFSAWGLTKVYKRQIIRK